MGEVWTSSVPFSRLGGYLWALGWSALPWPFHQAEVVSPFRAGSDGLRRPSSRQPERTHGPAPMEAGSSVVGPRSPQIWRGSTEVETRIRPKRRGTREPVRSCEESGWSSPGPCSEGHSSEVVPSRSWARAKGATRCVIYRLGTRRVYGAGRGPALRDDDRDGGNSGRRRRRRDRRNGSNSGRRGAGA